MPLSVSEASTVTIELLGKSGKVLTQTSVNQTSAGAFVARLSMKHVKPGSFTLHIVATGATSTPVDLPIRVRH